MSEEVNYCRDLNEAIRFVDTFCDLQTNPEVNNTVSVPYLQGKPGGGKTESIRAMAMAHNDEFISCHFALKQVEDLGGIPQFVNTVVNGTKVLSTVWSLPEFITSIYKKSDIAKVKEEGGFFIRNKNTGDIRIAKTGKFEENEAYHFNKDLEEVVRVKGDKKHHRVILLLDDMHRCEGFHMTALFEILTERKIHEYPIPKNVALVLAGNSSTKAGAKAMLSAIKNRVATIPVQTNFEFWKNNYALKHHVHPAVIAFLSAYNNFFHMDELQLEPWASPRSWTNFSNFLTAEESHSKKNVLTRRDINDIAYWHVGADAAEKFTAFYKVFNEFPCKEIFNTVKNPKDFAKYIEQYNYSQQYSLAYACINYYFRYFTSKNKNDFNNVIKCIIIAYGAPDGKHAHAELGTTILKELYNLFNTTDNKKFNLMDIINSLIDEDGNDIFIKMTDSILFADGE